MKEAISKARAEELWEAASQALLDLQGVLITIIQERAWEPLGYKTFTDAWTDRMSDITIMAELRPHVVYQMFSEGADIEAIAKAMKGISPKMAEILQRQRDNGVPAEFASTSNARPSRLPYATLFVKVPRDQLKRWRSIADHHGTTVEEIALSAIESAFDGMPEAKRLIS